MKKIELGPAKNGLNEAVLRFAENVYGKKCHDDDEYETLAMGFLLGAGFTHKQITPNVINDMCLGNFDAYMPDMFDLIKQRNESNPNKFYFIEAAKGSSEDGVPTVDLNVQCCSIEQKDKVLSEKEPGVILNSMKDYEDFVQKVMTK